MARQSLLVSLGRRGRKGSGMELSSGDQGNGAAAAAVGTRRAAVDSMVVLYRVGSSNGGGFR